jgi:outer membrane protein assembly factor BamB
VGTRNDPDFSGNNRDTVQYVFWGKDSSIFAPCRINTFVNPNTNKTYDDNRHDAVNAIWIRDTGAKSISSPALNAGNVYAGLSSENTLNDSGSLISLRTSDGSVNWQKNPDTTPGNDDDINSSPAIDGSGHIYIGSDGFVIAKYNSSGSKLRSTGLDHNIEGKPAVSDLKDRVYVVTDAARLWSLDKTDLTSEWPLPFDIGYVGGDYTSWPVIRFDAGLNKNIIYVGSMDGSLYAVRDDGAAGAILNSNFPYSTGGAIRGTPAINPVSEDVYFGSDDGTIYALSRLGGDRWSFTPGPIAAMVSSPAVTIDGGTVYVGSTNGHLYALNAVNGSQLWKYPDPVRTPGDPSRIGDVRGAPVIMGDGAICFGSDDGHLYALNPNGTLRWNFPATGSPIGAVRSKPVVDPSGIVYFGAEDGKIYAIDPSVNDPPNIPNLHLTAAELGATVSDVNNWFTEGPWAVRVEVQRSTTPNGSGKFEYTLKTWMKKCVDGVNCTNVLGQFFENTRFEYDWTTAGITPMTQTIELSNTPPDLFHDRFDRFLFGFTSASTASQTIDIRKFQLSFIRPNDLIQSD